jgi:hypothetical protein
MNTNNLKWLTSRQAIEDIKHFVDTMNVKYNIDNPRWITMGGSYAGKVDRIF